MNETNAKDSGIKEAQQKQRKKRKRPQLNKLNMVSKQLRLFIPKFELLALQRPALKHAVLS